MKKTRLLEIIREEITGALSEITIDVPNPGNLKAQQKQAIINKARQTNKNPKIGTADEPVDFIEENSLNVLSEGPFIEGPLDFAYINGKVEKNILGNAVASATQELKKAFPEIDSDAAAKIITSKKSRTAEKTPEGVKSALAKVDDAIEAQIDTFDDPDLLQNLINKKEVGTSPDEIKRINQYIEGEKMYVEKLGFPQTLRAVEKSISGEAPVGVEPKTVTKTSSAKKATLTKGDDGFDDVTYSKSETPASKESDEDKATKAAKKGGSKLDKMSNDKDALLKNKRAVEEKMKELAGEMKNTQGKEKDSLMGELKKLTKLKGELEKKLDQLGF
jgi:hypothetical protein